MARFINPFTDVGLADCETHEQFSDKLHFIFIELPAFNKEEEECETDFERWIYVLKNMEKLNRLPFKARKSVFEKLEQIVDIAALSKEEREMYDESIKVYRDNLVTMAYAEEHGLAKGREEGLAEGLVKGLVKGREEGLAKGREEERTSIARIARNLKAIGLDTTAIHEATGLTPEEIQEL